MPLSQPAQPGYGGLAGSNPLCTKVSRVLPSEPSSSQLVVSLSANRRVALARSSNSTNLAPGVQFEAAHREAAAHVRLDVHVGTEPLAELLRLDHRVEHLVRCRVDMMKRATRPTQSHLCQLTLAR